MADISFEREWAMPNGKTFTIKPIKEFVEIEVERGGHYRRSVCKFVYIRNYPQ